MKETADDSILAWSLAPTEARQEQTVGQTISGPVLATSPAAFERCGDVVQRPTGRLETHINAFDIFGGRLPISMSLHPSPAVTDPSGRVVYGYLSCGSRAQPSLVAAIPLVSCHLRRSSAHAGPTFLRPRGLNTIYLPEPSDIPHADPILIRNDPPHDTAPSGDESYWFYLPPTPYPWNAKIDDVYPADCYKRDAAMLKTPREQDLGTEQALFLVRFSYPIPNLEGDAVGDAAIGWFILALEFFGGSAVGTREPQAYLFCEGRTPTPLDEIVSFWPSLACSRTTEFADPRIRSSIIKVSLEKVIYQHPLWVVSLTSVSSRIQSCQVPLGWPNIRKQIRVRGACSDLVQLVSDELKLSHRYQRNLGALHHIDGEVSKRRTDLERIDAEMAKLKAQADNLRSELRGLEQDQSRLRDATSDISSGLDAVSQMLVAIGDTEPVQSVWPTTPGQVLNQKQSYARRRERDGAIRHIMKDAPIKLHGREYGWVPGITLLMYAAATGDPEFVRRILRYDSDTMAKDSLQRTALDWAALSGLDGFSELVRDWVNTRPGSSDNITDHDRAAMSRVQSSTSIPASNGSESETPAVGLIIDEERGEIQSRDMEQEPANVVSTQHAGSNPRHSRHRRSTNPPPDPGLPSLKTGKTLLSSAIRSNC